MNNFSLDALLGGLRSVESSGRYNVLGPLTRKGDRAYGAYQVMGQNVPQWTQEAIGQRMSPQEFLNSPQAQDAVARHRFGGYLSKFGNPQDAISSWFSGRPLAQARGASDGYMKTPDYVNKVLKYAGTQSDPAQGPANPANSSVLADRAPQALPQYPGSSEVLGYAPMPPKRPEGLGGASNAIQDTFGNPGANQQVPVGQPAQQPQSDDTWSRLGSMGNGLVGLGAAISSLSSNPNISQTLMGMYRQGQQQQQKWPKVVGTENGQVITQNEDGSFGFHPIPGGAGANLPSSVREAQYFKEHPEDAEVYKKLHGDDNQGQETSLNDAGVESAAEGVIAGNPQAYTGLTKKGKELVTNKIADFKKQYGVTDEDMMTNKGKWAGVFAEERKYGTRLADTRTAKKELDASVENLNSLEVPKELTNGTMPWNTFMQKSTEWLNANGYPALAKYREGLWGVSRAYSRVMSMGGTNTTVHSDEMAEKLLNTTMSPEAVKGVTEFMKNSGERVFGALEQGQKEMRTKARHHDDFRNSDHAADDVYQEVYKRAGMGDNKPTPAPQAAPAAPPGAAPAGGSPRINNDDEYDKLPSGATFIDPNGKLRKKP